MFTGIIESTGKVVKREDEGGNVVFGISSPISHELKIDQSIAHDGVCLTVVKQENDWHEVVAIKETLDKSNLGGLAIDDLVNLERCMVMNGRLDGHMVQGHVDTTGKLLSKEDQKGSWKLTFQFDDTYAHLLISKGSVTINGISLTVIDPTRNTFSVAIIPYTWEHTNLYLLTDGDHVNLEFDVIGKYIHRKEELAEL